MLVTETPESELSQTPKPAAPSAKNAALPSHPDQFPRRHIGPGAEETRQMLELLGYPTLEALIDEAIPANIRLQRPLQLPAGRTEHQTIADLREIAAQNQVFRSFIGMGYSDC